ncbi:MAG: calcium/sodium antiporter [Pseudohongiellaceae bacterium]
MLFNLILIVIGFIGLIWGADKFIYGASAIAKSLGFSPLLIGLTIVAFGTSAPEIFSSAVSALEGKPELAIGNAIGSNLFNIGVALGIAAIIKPLKPPESVLGKELPALILVTIITALLLINFELGRFDSFVLIAIIGYFGYRLFREQTNIDAIPAVSEDKLGEVSTPLAALYLAFGLVLLVLGAEVLVHASSEIAERLGVSTAIIGLTIVALGTSLPELAACVACVLRGHHELAIGNIIGSNILNLLAVLPFPGLFSPGGVERMLVLRDFPVLLLLTALLVLFCYRSIKQNRAIGRAVGSVFLLIYCGWFMVMLLQAHNSL